MTDFEDSWQMLVDKKPLLADDLAVVEIKACNLRLLLRQFYERGLDAGQRTTSLFDQVFGKQ